MAAGYEYIYQDWHGIKGKLNPKEKLAYKIYDFFNNFREDDLFESEFKIKRLDNRITIGVYNTILEETKYL